MMFSRFLRAQLFATLAAGAVLALPVGTGHAAAPQIRTAAPGYYRTMLGDFEITALSDGTVALPLDKILTNTSPDKVAQALSKHRQSSPLETSVNAYLINTGDKLVLIDSGAGNFYGAARGKLRTSLLASGYLPEQVDEIYITHMHTDHIGGLLNGDQAAFPNAVVRVDQRDADSWLSQANLEQAPANAQATYRNAMAALKPYIQAGKFRTFDGDTQLLPGIKAVAAPGHTPGHSIYRIESQGRKLMLWGDLMHVAAVQFEQPAVTVQFDHDSKAAADQRKKAYADAAQHGYLVGAAHLSFPGLGYLRQEGAGYVWIPLNYATLR